MEFEWDEGKDAANHAKHGVSLGDVVLLDWTAVLDEIDVRTDYNELRFRSLIPMSGRVYFCAYTIRNGVHRIISLRKANAREVMRYEQTKT